MAGKTLAILTFVAAPLLVGTTPGGPALLPVALRAQSLGDVAKAEAQRRAATGKATRVYTNESLRPEPQPEVPLPVAPSGEGLAALAQPGAGRADAATAAAALAPGTKPALPPVAQGPAAPAKAAVSEPSSESEWRTRAADLRGQVVRQRILADALQSRINALLTDFVNRDDPAQRAVIEQDRVKALAELDRVKTDLKSAQQAVTDLEDQARRKSVPAGWLR